MASGAARHAIPPVPPKTAKNLRRRRLIGTPPGEAEHPLREAKPPLPKTERLLAGAGGQLRGRANSGRAGEAPKRETAASPEARGGWESQADRAPVGQLPQPANLVATGGDLEGTVDLSWDALRRGVQTYIAQQATSPSGPWTQCYLGKASSCTVTGLTSGTQYWFQVSPIGAAGPSAWSEPTTKRAT